MLYNYNICSILYFKCLWYAPFVQEAAPVSCWAFPHFLTDHQSPASVTSLKPIVGKPQVKLTD